jgi:hypothetical protein
LNAFTSLLSLLNNVQGQDEPILQYWSQFDGLIMELSRCKVTISHECSWSCCSFSQFTAIILTCWISIGLISNHLSWLQLIRLSRTLRIMIVLRFMNVRVASLQSLLCVCLLPLLLTPTRRVQYGRLPSNGFLSCTEKRGSSYDGRTLLPVKGSA